jgi:hypothetical protein
VQRVRDGDCWYKYERDVTEAMNDYENCLDGFSIWNPLRWACGAEWLIRVEGDWVEFWACNGLGI